MKKTRLISGILALILLIGCAFSCSGSAAAEGTMTDLGSVAAGAYHSMFLQPDGTVQAVGRSNDGVCNVSGWTDICKISASNRSLGLRKDGTVVYAGHRDNTFDVSGWTDIQDIAAGNWNAIGLKRDGTVVITGRKINGQEATASWYNIIQVAVDDTSFYGLRSDGTVVAVSGNNSGKLRCTAWTDITAISVGANRIVGLKSNGTLVCEGFPSGVEAELGSWHNVVKVSCGGYHTVALLADGTVKATGNSENGECKVDGWHDIVDISAGMHHTLGLRKDGTVLAAGSDGYGQCRVSGMHSVGAQQRASLGSRAIEINQYNWDVYFEIAEIIEDNSLVIDDDGIYSMKLHYVVRVKDAYAPFVDLSRKSVIRFHVTYKECFGVMDVSMPDERYFTDGFCAVGSREADTVLVLSGDRLCVAEFVEMFTLGTEEVGRTVGKIATNCTVTEADGTLYLYI